MKRVTEKVKDIVDVRAFAHVSDFAADPAQTLAGYHFTDITADLMAKWLDRIAQVRPEQGAALALAGFRGVGKSHFLAALAAIVSRPELRSRTGDAHVASAADRLPRRNCSVAFVRRGSGSSLVDEVKRAMAELLDVSPNALSESLSDLLLRGSEHAGDSPLTILIDTAPGRENRVARDDGPAISEIAAAAKPLGVFVGVALDDDISGADGPNSSIAANFTIDYLDQEHLYKIVDSHVFTKSSQQLPLLREIYGEYRELFPGFRWSEQRFTSLYPLHPATVEIAPLIRLYIHDFALLGFASEAGLKILGRPANSLIGLDEVFDSVEMKLRSVEGMKEAFTAFDSLEQHVVSKLPVQQRLQAKLLLKGLLLLSLDGRGADSTELAASMLIFGDERSNLDIETILDSFAADPQLVDRVLQDQRPPRYCLSFGAAKADDELAGAAANVSEDSIWNALLRLTAEKLSDVELSSVETTMTSPCSVEWRGGIRRGEVVWGPAEHVQQTDWIVAVGPAGSVPFAGAIDWRVADLTADEKDTIRRFVALQSDADVRTSLGEELATSLRVLSISAEKIWQRVFLRDARIAADGKEYEFPGDSFGSLGLGQLLTPILSEVFEKRFPEHPRFGQLLGHKQGAALVARFFSGGDTTSPEAQELAATLALPLGLAVPGTDGLVPSAPDILKKLPVLRSALEGFDHNTRSLSLSDLDKRMGSSPFGLTREAQHLVLASLVAQREFEFVTSSGNRINHRSLDLQIIWDDIVGIARPLNEAFAPERLLTWARLATGNAALASVDRKEERELIADSLASWLKAWKESRVLADFDGLPDSCLNAAIWKTATGVRRSFGAMAEAIEGLAAEATSLEECLHAIAENFSDSEADFEKKKAELRSLTAFVRGVTRRKMIASYLAACDVTAEPAVEQARIELLAAIEPSSFWANTGEIEHIEGLWQTFHAAYSEFYIDRHASAAGVEAQETLGKVLSSPEWPVFDALSRNAEFSTTYGIRVQQQIRELRGAGCTARVNEVLESLPYCTCGFRPGSADGSGTDVYRLINEALQQAAYGPDAASGVPDGDERISATVLARLQRAVPTSIPGPPGNISTNGSARRQPRMESTK